MERTVASKVQTQHGLLKSQLAAAARAIDDESGADSVQRVERLARSLEAHLTLEEEHYFPKTLADDPGLGRVIGELLLDHDDLRRCLSDTLEKLSEGNAAAGSAALHDYEAKFQAHEKREYDLLGDADASAA